MIRLFGAEPRPPAPGRFLQVDGLTLHLQSAGPAPQRFLLLHGYLSNTSTYHEVLPVLGAHGGAVALDLPGCGYSDRRAEAPAAPEAMAELIPPLCQAMGVPRVVLVGHSLGGAVALFCAAKHPELVAGLALVTPFVYPQKPPPGLRLAERWPSLARRAFASPLGRLAVARLLQRASCDVHGQHPRRRAQRLLAHLDAPGGWMAAQRIGVAAMAGVPDEALLARVAQPVLTLWGGADRVRGVQLGERLCADLAGPSQLQVFEDCGHNLQEEAPRRFAARVAQWAQRLD